MDNTTVPVSRPRAKKSVTTNDGDAPQSATLESDEPAGMILSKEEGVSRLKQLATSEPNRVALIIKAWIGK